VDAHHYHVNDLFYGVEVRNLPTHHQVDFAFRCGSLEGPEFAHAPPSGFRISLRKFGRSWSLSTYELLV
jgi:hypothetical protein